MNNKAIEKLGILSKELKKELERNYFSNYNFDVIVSEHRVIVSKDSNSILGDIMEYTKTNEVCSIFQYGISGIKSIKDDIKEMKNDLLVASQIANNIEKIKDLFNGYTEKAKKENIK